MANIRKSFNFRNGVQVDNDNFVVNANGLVGIGTSVPQNYLLNVYGDTRTTGLTTTQDLFVTQNAKISGITTVGVLTASSIDVANGVNVGGALTAATLKLTNGETVDNLIGFARTTFITDGVGIHTVSKIGIGTTSNVNYQLDVLGDTRVTGIVSATTFDGALNSTNLTGTINNDRLPDLITSNINASSGVSTFTELKVGTAITMSAGIITATTFKGNLTGNVTGNITGNVTGNITGNVTGTATTATNLSDGANITTGTISDARLPNLITSNINSTSGVSTFTELKVGTAITMSAGIITATSFDGVLNSTNLTGTINNDRLPVTPQFTSIGIGTDSPTDALHIQQSGAAEIYVGSDSAASSLRVGRNLDDNDSGMVKYGNTSGIYPYSTEKSLDFMNFGQGNVNFYIEAGITTTSDFNFNWNKGGNTNLMTLTKGGNLGIGITNPTHKLNVQGISTFTDNAHFNSNVTIDGSLNFSAGANITATLIGDVQNSSSNVILDVSEPRVNANVFIQTGISTFNEVSIGSTSKSENVVIGGGNVVRTDLEDVITANNETNRFFVNSSGSIGIKTTISYGLDIGVNCTTKQALFSGVGIGTTSMRCAVDFADAGTLGVTTHTYLVPPKVSTSNRNGIAGTITGATIYNITDNKLQVYTGSTWETITSS